MCFLVKGKLFELLLNGISGIIMKVGKEGKTVKLKMFGDEIN